MRKQLCKDFDGVWSRRSRLERRLQELSNTRERSSLAIIISDQNERVESETPTSHDFIVDAIDDREFLANCYGFATKATPKLFFFFLNWWFFGCYSSCFVFQFVFTNF